MLQHTIIVLDVHCSAVSSRSDYCACIFSRQHYPETLRILNKDVIGDELLDVEALLGSWRRANEEVQRCLDKSVVVTSCGQQ